MAAKKKANVKKKSKGKKTSKKKKATVKQKVNPIPEGYTTITASLRQAQATATIEFCKAAFGAKVKAHLEMPNGDVLHAQLKIGDALLHVGSAMPGEAVKSNLMLYVKNVDKVLAAALAAGAKIVMPLENAFWGDRFVAIEDPQGNIWEIASRLEILTIAQLKKRTKAFFEQMGAGA